MVAAAAITGAVADVREILPWASTPSRTPGSKIQSIRSIRRRTKARQCWPRVRISGVARPVSKKHPIGLGPYKFVSHTPGVELVMEAFEGYRRKMPSVKRPVFKVVPEATTRMAMLKRGEVDIAYLLDVPQAQEVK